MHPTIGRCQKPNVLDYLLYPEGQKMWKKQNLWKRNHIIRAREESQMNFLLLEEDNSVIALEADIVWKLAES